MSTQRTRPGAILANSLRANPRLWAALDELLARFARGSLPGSGSWPAYVRVPMPIARQAMLMQGKLVRKLSEIELDDSVNRLMALAAWRTSQRVVRLDDTLYDAVIATEYDGPLTAPLLGRLDGAAVYVQLRDIVFRGKPVHGFFMCLSHEPAQSTDWLVVVLDMGPGEELLPISFALEATSIKDSIVDLVLEVEVQSHLEGDGCGVDSARIASEIRDVYGPVLTLAVYLCTDALELRSRERQPDGAWLLTAGESVGAMLREQAHRLDLHLSREARIDPSGLASRHHVLPAWWEVRYAGRQQSVQWHGPSVVLANAPG